MQEICGAYIYFGNSFIVTTLPNCCLYENSNVQLVKKDYLFMLRCHEHYTCHMQKERDASKFDNVVLLLQDMLEVITRDMMVNEIRLLHFALMIITPS